MVNGSKDAVCPELCDLLQAALEINPEKRLTSLKVFQFLIASLAKHYGLRQFPGGYREVSSELKQSLIALDERSAQRLYTIAGAMERTQEITISVDRQLVTSGSVVSGSGRYLTD